MIRVRRAVGVSRLIMQYVNHHVLQGYASKVDWNMQAPEKICLRNEIIASLRQASRDVMPAHAITDWTHFGRTFTLFDLLGQSQKVDNHWRRQLSLPE